MTTLINRLGNICIWCIGAALAVLAVVTALVMVWLSFI